MDQPTFVRLIERELGEILLLNQTKGIEYSGTFAVNKTVREIAESLGVEPTQALMTFATKHWQAINSYVRTGEVRSEPIQERIRDLQLYLLLLLALIEDKETAARLQADNATSGVMWGRSQVAEHTELSLGSERSTQNQRDALNMDEMPAETGIAAEAQRRAEKGCRCGEPEAFCMCSKPKRSACDCTLSSLDCACDNREIGHGMGC